MSMTMRMTMTMTMGMRIGNGILPAAMALLVSGTSAAGQEVGRVPLFASDEPIELTLTADFNALEGDRRGEAPERPATVTMTGAAGEELSLDAQLRTRGRFRRDRANCSFPPLRINFKKQQVEGTVFGGQNKLKIVGSCRPNRDSYEQLVLQEYLAYRTFQSVGATAFQVRLARITYVDISGDDEPFTRFAFFIEDDDAMAMRVSASVLDVPEGRNLPPDFLDPSHAATLSVFHYMIGNTDWSDVAAHNTELLDMAGTGIPVPYDFDFAGIVNAPYSTPDPTLNLRSVRERFYRGWCWSGLDMGSVLGQFRGAEDDIVTLYEDFPYLKGGERKRALSYLSGFFDDIETDRRAESLFLRDCRTVPSRTAARN